MKRLRQGGFLIAKIHQAAGRIFAKRLKAYNLEAINPAQGRILFVLWEQDGISIQELSKKTSLGKSTLTSMLDRLEEAGHLKRVPSKEDRRKIIICLTMKDRKMRDIYNRVSEEMTGLFYRGFTAEEIGRFEQSLTRVLHNLSDPAMV
jgi:MarR family transcriptional regulator, organic hydroperoxide resistance regulator